MKDTKARSFVMIMITIAVSAVFLRVVIESVIKISIVQNESNAQATLRLISAALENYAKEHLGSFPLNLSALVQSDPPYIDKTYISKSSIRGYKYSCSRLESSNYSCSAQPVICNLTGRMIYTVTTGGLFLSEECRKKD